MTEDQIHSLNENIQQYQYEQGLRTFGKTHHLTAHELAKQVKGLPKIQTTQMLQNMNQDYRHQMPPIKL